MVGMLNTSRTTSDLTSHRTFRAIPVTLLLIQALLLAYLSWSTSPNRTEAGHLGAAVYLWHTGKFDIFHVNPPLVRFIAGAPIALLCHPEHDFTGYSPRPQDRSEWRLGNAFIAANEPDDLRLYIFLARAACIPLILLGGYFGYRFASELYGQWSGITFLTLWTFSPLILGWGATLCPDVHAASFGVIGLYTFWHWLKSPTWKKATLAGICLGLMPLTKMTWIIAFPIWLMVFFVSFAPFFNRKERKGARDATGFAKIAAQFAVIILLGLWMMNMGYLFDGSFRQLKNYQFISSTLTGQEITKGRAVAVGNRFADSWMGHIPVPLPAEFVQGIDTQKIDFERGMDSYARGEWSERGWRWYYGYVLLLREPLGIWGLAILAFCMFFASFAVNFFNRKERKESQSTQGRGSDPLQYNASRRDELTILIPLFLIFAFISSQDGFSINPRYIVFVLPLLYIFISKAASTTHPLSLGENNPLSLGENNPLSHEERHNHNPLSLWEVPV